MAKILIVEDDDEVRDVLKTLLQEEGHELFEASDGNQAIEQFRRTPADLVILDIVLPDKEGLETIIDLRRTHPNVKIMAMSGGGRTSPQDYLDMAKRLGAVEVIAKPFSIDDFLRCVNLTLKHDDGQ
jgi:DNA-binding response OmpR family regulator